MTTPVPAAEPVHQPPAFASSAMTVLSFLVLLPTGAAVGVLFGFGMSWFSHHWPLGLLVQVGSVAAVLVLLALVYALTRLAAWGGRRQSAATGFAVGYVLVLLGMIGYLPGGDIVFSAAVVNYVFLFGSMVALAAGVMRSATFPGPRGPSSVGRVDLTPPDLAPGQPGSPFDPAPGGPKD
ncbi:hypothetical protein [Nocardiopsis sp. MG754419]|uniref:hypothetical protein n=1 Tax=Nocardiopsis sp. MG754419 TaxID=2259865 RepID=UPI001BA7E427|nr:hypothetical protein [Nocardiopsis sp. MG754419]MBR8744601.1 hypothetical protein [Nocardiopsis sp. MG754419]